MADRVDISEVTGFGLVAILLRKGFAAEAIGTRLGITAPTSPQWTGNGDLALIGSGPAAWLARADKPAPDWADAISGQLADLASVTEVSDSYRVFRISGGNARRLLHRGAFIDLHPTAFAPGSVAVTVIAHIGVILRQLDDVPTYEIAVFRSFGESFRHWLTTAAANLDVE